MAFLSSIFFLPSSRLESCDAIAFHIVHCKLFCCTFLFVVVQLHWYAPSDAMLAECECGKSVCFWRLVKLLSSLARFQRVCVCVSVCRMEVDMSVVHDSEWWRTLSHCFISDFINTHTHESSLLVCWFVQLSVSGLFNFHEIWRNNTGSLARDKKKTAAATIIKTVILSVNSSRHGGTCTVCWKAIYKQRHFSFTQVKWEKQLTEIVMRLLSPLRANPSSNSNGFETHKLFSKFYCDDWE